MNPNQPTFTVTPSLTASHLLLVLLATLFISFPVIAKNNAAEQPLPQVRMETSEGVIEIMLRPDVAPETVENFLNYVESGFYQGTVFHRVIPGFMIQGGGFDPNLSRKDVNSPIQNEASPTLKNLRGTVAMARTSQPHSATSQFFINVVDNPYLNASDNPKKWGYAVFGKVTEGMGVVDAIARKQTGYSGGMADVPNDPIIIRSITVINNGDTSGK
ncbi:cyclophilin type peptidyl-prolyl cis-trans isomerase [Marinobacter lipolyticus SM19]|uniref:Peptidyl-prolyl cis-trans isomerase n=1 Tax=Marinobacter lipolyticus SM19 TaxID=1318628 RepID=R8B1G5_9GAMM|nr:cyclophilin type peptidyl-prolyl cis-trans isomerase [Marinobacter lipolyticus SM19]